MTHGLVVVGASLAGIRTAMEARTAGYPGDILVLGEENALPYDRPPLSKGYLRGELADDAISLVSADRLEELSIELRLDARAVGVDPEGRQVLMEDGSAVDYAVLVIATGARARSLPLRQPSGVFSLRTKQDSLSISQCLRQSDRLVIIGGGFIGLEVASVAQELGKTVDVIEADVVPLGRAVGSAVGDLIAEFHRDRGVNVRTSTTVTEFRGENQLEAVVLDDGSEIPTSLAVVGIGTQLNSEWLGGLGVEPGQPVPCTADGRAVGADNVFVVGDIAQRLTADGGSHRVEHWSNAVDQARVVGLTIAGKPSTTQIPVPSFWSDQFGHKIQMVGVIDGEPDEVLFSPHAGVDRQSFALLRNGDRFAAAVTFGWPRMAGRFRKLLAEDASWDQAVAAAQEVADGPLSTRQRAMATTTSSTMPRSQE